MADAQYFELCSLVIVRLVSALHGSVMNTMPPSCKREVRTEVLIDMMADLNLSCPRKNPGIITSTLAWSGSVPHNMSLWSLQNGRPEALIDNDRISPDHYYVCTVWLRDENGTTMIGEGCVPEVAVHMMRPFHFLFLRRGSTVYNYHTCTVSSGDDHHTTMTFSSCRFDGLDGWYLEVFFVRSGSLSFLCLDCMVSRRTPYQWWSAWWEPSACLVCNVASHGRLVAEQIPVLDIAIFVLHGLVINTVPPWSLTDSLAQEFGCDDYRCIWVVWSRETYPQPWHVMDIDAEVLVVMAGVVLCFLCSSTGRRPVCSKYALCGPVMFTFSLGLARGSQKPMVVEMEVSLQVSFLWPCKSVFFMLSLFLERRCEQVPVMNIEKFALYGLVMNLTPPWSLRDVLRKLCLTWFFSSVLDRHCFICSVWCLDEDTTMIVADRTLDAPFFSWRRPSDLLTACVSLCGFLINTSHCDVSRTLVSIPPRNARYPLTNDNRHGGSHLRVSSVTEPVIVFV